MIKKYINFFLFTCICFIIADIFVNADELDNFIVPSGAQFYDNASGTLNAITTDYVNNSGDNFYMSYAIHTIPSSAGAAISFNLNEPLIAGYTYTISVSVGPTGCGETRLSSLNRIGIGGSFSSAKTYYQDGGNATIKFSDYQVAGQGYKGVSFAFTPNRNGTYIVIPYTTANNCNDINYFYGYTINNLGPANNVSQQDINNSINNQTTIFNNSIQASTNDIQSSIQSTEENIINNQNENNLNDINNSRINNVKDCSNAIEFNLSKGYRITTSNELVEEQESYYSKDYVTIPNGITNLTITNSDTDSLSGYYIILYNSSKNVLDYFYSNNRTITLPSGSKYFRLSTKSPTIQVFTGNKGCKNRISAIDDTLNDDDTTGATDEASDFFSSFSTNTFGLTSIITAPLNLIQSLTSSTCTPLHIPLPFLDNKYIDLPCMTSIYQSAFGSFFTMYQTVTFGIIAYWVCVRVFNQVKDFKNPEHDEIEVLDL